MRALSIRQPFAEMILRGMKTVEYRSRPTRIIGERFWIYASKGSGFRVQGSGKKAWSLDLAMAGDGAVPPWMLELAEGLRMVERGALTLPTGVIVGSAVIEGCREVRGERESREVRGQRVEGREDKSWLTSNLQPLPSSLASNLQPLPSFFEWRLSDVRRSARPRKPAKHPQPVWF